MNTKQVIPTLAVLLLSACGVSEPEARVAFVEELDVPAALSRTAGGSVTIHYLMGACDELVGPSTARTDAGMTVAVFVQPPRRGTSCTAGMVAGDVVVDIAPPVAGLFQLTVHRMQGDTTYTIPVE